MKRPKTVLTSHVVQYYSGLTFLSYVLELEPGSDIPISNVKSHRVLKTVCRQTALRPKLVALHARYEYEANNLLNTAVG